MSELKTFMLEKGIEDILMRILQILEMKRIQGFSDQYVLKGPKDKQKKFIGNSVVTDLVEVWMRAMAAEIRNNSKALAA